MSKCDAGVGLDVNVACEVDVVLKFTGSKQSDVVMNAQTACSTSVKGVVDTAVVLKADQFARSFSVLKGDLV